MTPLLDGLTLASPRWLWLLAPAVVATLLLSARRRPPAIAWPALAEARAAGARRLDLRRILGYVLRAVSLAALACVLAEPVGVHRAPPEPGLGLDLILVIDASGSMGAIDARDAGGPRTRISLAREVVSRFAEARAAEGDRVGLVVFGASAFTACPLTSDGRLLAEALRRVDIGVAGDATALGDALALAVKRAVVAGSSLPGADPQAGRVVVLLTDGRSNTGSIPLETATELARAEGVRVHTVGIGSDAAEVPIEIVTGDRRELAFEHLEVDVVGLGRIAERTGGRTFEARRSDQLAAVYHEIDGLERVVRRSPPRIRHTARPEPLLALAGCCLLAEVGFTRVLRRGLP